MWAYHLAGMTVKLTCERIWKTSSSHLVQLSGNIKVPTTHEITERDKPQTLFDGGPEVCGDSQGHLCWKPSEGGGPVLFVPDVVTTEPRVEALKSGSNFQDH